MNTPVTIYDCSEKDRKKLLSYFLAAVFLTLVVQIAVDFPCFFLPLLFLPALTGKAVINRFSISHFVFGMMGDSLAWSEISGVEVNREHQKLIVTGKPRGKKLPVSIVVKCPNGKLDSVLVLLSEKLPASALVIPSKNGLESPAI